MAPQRYLRISHLVRASSVSQTSGSEATMKCLASPPDINLPLLGLGLAPLAIVV